MGEMPYAETKAEYEERLNRDVGGCFGCLGVFIVLAALLFVVQSIVKKDVPFTDDGAPLIAIALAIIAIGPVVASMRGGVRSRTDKKQRDQAAAHATAPAASTHKRCPECAERVQAAARLCRFCGHRFEPQPAAD